MRLRSKIAIAIVALAIVMLLKWTYDEYHEAVFRESTMIMQGY